jgi:hypothetical protein
VFEHLLTNLPAGIKFIDQLATPRTLNTYVESAVSRRFSLRRGAISI